MLVDIFRSVFDCRDFFELRFYVTITSEVAWNLHVRIKILCVTIMIVCVEILFV